MEKNWKSILQQATLNNKHYNPRYFPSPANSFFELQDPLDMHVCGNILPLVLLFIFVTDRVTVNKDVSGKNMVDVPKLFDKIFC